MKWKEVWTARSPKLRKLAVRYKWVLLVIALGGLFLLLPSGEAKAEAEPKSREEAAAAFDLEAMEEKFQKALSEIAGAGEVTVVLTVKTGTRQVIAEDSKLTEQSGGFAEESSAVLVSRGSGVQETVRLQEIYPQFQGALIVCDGGSDPAVRLKLTEATSALTGLGADKISICSRGK